MEDAPTAAPTQRPATFLPAWVRLDDPLRVYLRDGTIMGALQWFCLERRVSPTDPELTTRFLREVHVSDQAQKTTDSTTSNTAIGTATAILDILRRCENACVPEERMKHVSRDSDTVDSDTVTAVLFEKKDEPMVVLKHKRGGAHTDRYLMTLLKTKQKSADIYDVICVDLDTLVKYDIQSKHAIALEICTGKNVTHSPPSSPPRTEIASSAESWSRDMNSGVSLLAFRTSYERLLVSAQTYALTLDDYDKGDEWKRVEGVACS